ncbi:Uncharacterised protein [Klebsiella pneumoniae]|uniref:Uncharacterized protein n=1 Tax=Klebsiella pneumoniae TaxID=573 RepID=A0A378F561_KLEPN|nr:Uncharacterised protein [Klebsiella pneumoniae]
MAIFKAEDKEVYIADYEHLAFTPAVYRPGDVGHIPAEDLWLANNRWRSSAGHHSVLRAASGKRRLLALIEQMDDEGLDDFPAFANCWGSPPEKTTAGIPCASAS